MQYVVQYFGGKRLATVWFCQTVREQKSNTYLFQIKVNTLRKALKVSFYFSEFFLQEN